MVAAGFLCVIVGAALHWPDFVMASSMHWRMVGMPFSPTMIAGMGFIGLGLVLAAVGVVRPSRPTGDRRRRRSASSSPAPGPSTA